MRPYSNAFIDWYLDHAEASVCRSSAPVVWEDEAQALEQVDGDYFTILGLPLLPLLAFLRRKQMLFCLEWATMLLPRCARSTALLRQAIREKRGTAKRPGRSAARRGWPASSAGRSRDSLSPWLHGLWLQHYRIDGAYVPLAVRRPSRWCSRRCRSSDSAASISPFRIKSGPWRWSTRRPDRLSDRRHQHHRRRLEELLMGSNTDVRFSRMPA